MIQQRADLSPRLTYSLTFPDKKSRYLRNFAKGSATCNDGRTHCKGNHQLEIDRHELLIGGAVRVGS